MRKELEKKEDISDSSVIDKKIEIINKQMKKINFLEEIVSEEINKLRELI